MTRIMDAETRLKIEERIIAMLKTISDVTRKYMVWVLIFDIIIYVFCQINKLVLKTYTELTCLC